MSGDLIQIVGGAREADVAGDGLFLPDKLHPKPLAAGIAFLGQVFFLEVIPHPRLIF